MSTIKKFAEDFNKAQDEAYNNFCADVMDQFCKTKEEAAKVFTVFKKVKALGKFDYPMRRYPLTNGAFWDLEVINRALDA